MRLAPLPFTEACPGAFLRLIKHPAYFDKCLTLHELYPIYLDEDLDLYIICNHGEKMKFWLENTRRIHGNYLASLEVIIPEVEV